MTGHLKSSANLPVNPLTCHVVYYFRQRVVYNEVTSFLQSMEHWLTCTFFFQQKPAHIKTWNNYEYAWKDFCRKTAER